jgi:pimeloyl-ACP methyl ester carboxylesterase
VRAAHAKGPVLDGALASPGQHQPSADPDSGNWDDASVWIGDGVRRECFMFPFGDTLLYGSIYAATELRHPFGLLICSSWGLDAERAHTVSPPLAMGMARLGGVAFRFDYPGTGDSFGDYGTASIETWSGAALAALREAECRYPGTNWVMVGLMLGASVAAVTARAADIRHFLLLQPSFDPGGYVDTTIQKARRRPLGSGDTANTAFGYPIPGGLRTSEGNADVSAGLAQLSGRGAVVRYAEPEDSEPAPRGFDVVTIPGRWRIGHRGYSELVDPALEWLEGAVGADPPPVLTTSEVERLSHPCPDHPVLIPTSAGPVGAVISEPERSAGIAMVYLPGGGDAERAGINASWTRAARAISRRGVTVLRLDHPTYGESWMARDGPMSMLDAVRLRYLNGTLSPEEVEWAASLWESTQLQILGETVDWFRARAGNLPLLVAGSCMGGYHAALLASTHPAVLAVAMLTPPLVVEVPGYRQETSSLDSPLVDAVRNALAAKRVRLIVGERDGEEQFRLKEALGPAGDALELEVIPGLALHPFRSPAAQRQSVEHLLAWVAEFA